VPSKEELKIMFDEYNSLLNQNGYSEKSVGWNKPKHNLRFNIALEPWQEIKDDIAISVLDLGCGLGHLYSHLKNHNFKWQYMGIDLNSKLIEKAKSYHKIGDFLEGDLSAIKENKSFDIIFIIGTFNRQFGDSEKHLEQTLKDCFKISKLGVHISALAPWALEKYKKNFYPSLDLYEKCMDRNYVSSINIKSDKIPGELSVDYFLKD
tara:strand:- start:559 stop:1179 length:621 start_codon:yes stop_codon:yes gene_type:complete